MPSIGSLCESLPDHQLFAFPARRRAPSCPPDCLRPSASSVTVSQAPLPFKSTRASLRSPNEAAISTRVHWRWACPKFLRQTFVEWVEQAVCKSFWARAFYDSHRARGSGHNATTRALAFKWIRILYRCWVDRTNTTKPATFSSSRSATLPSSNSPPTDRLVSLAVRPPGVG